MQKKYPHSLASGLSLNISELAVFQISYNEAFDMVRSITPKPEKVKKRHKALILITIVLVGVPLFLWLWWVFTPPRPVSIFIMDKTTFSQQQARNRSINWVLKHYKFVKPEGAYYHPQKDYYGFIPLSNEEYKVRDLAGMSSLELERLSIKYHIAYYVDSYGVYSNMWPEDNADSHPVTKLYGGLDWEDLLFLEKMFQRHRLVIAEFIFLAPPTGASQRAAAEKLLGIQWQGWTGRYFDQLDMHHYNSTLPRWVTTLYQEQYGQPWPYSGNGVVLIHENKPMVVLTREHLRTPRIEIEVSSNIRKQYGVSNNIYYPGWFDITLPVSADNEAMASYRLDVNEEGLALLQQNNLTASFPAVIRSTGEKKMYYFAGDFGHTPLRYRFIRMKGARYAELFLSDLNDMTDKSGFFYAFYLPMLKSIITNYQKELTQH